jgi:hypothetical protein
VRKHKAQKIQRRVASRAVQLDMLNPGWESKVDTGRIDLLDNEGCVLGMVYGDAEHSPFMFKLPLIGRVLLPGFFYMKISNQAWATECWRREVEARRVRVPDYVPEGLLSENG